MLDVMSVRMSVAVASLVVAAVGCSAVTPTEPASAPNLPVGASESAKTPAPDPGVSWLRVEPQVGARDSTVSLDVACLDTLGPVRSPALDIDELQPDPAGHQPWHLTGTATVSDAAPGQYSISATCGTETLSAAFTVVPHH